jgi:hypothetical protein
VIHSATASVRSGERGILVSQSAKSITFLWLALCVASCNTDPEYDRLNLETDCFDVQVAPESAVGDDDDDDSADDDDDSAGDDDDSAGDDDDSTTEPEPSGLEMPLIARPGLFGDDLLGTAWVTPASGPAGTHFLITVVLEDNGLETGNPTGAVDRITVVVDNGSLTATEFDMEPSPADESRWTLTMAAGGDPETTLREDRLCLAVYAEIE